METKQISLKQFTALFFLSRVTLELLHTVNDRDSAIGSERVFGLLLMLPIVFIFSLPIFWLINYNGNYGAVELARNTNKPFGIAVACMYLMFFLYNILFTLNRTEMFMSVNKISENNAPLILFVLILAACFCVMLGISALGRAGSALRVFIIILMIITFAVLFGMMALLNMYESPNVTGVNILGSAWREAIKTNEITVFIVLLSRINLPKQIDKAKNIITEKVALKQVISSFYSILLTTTFVLVMLFISTRLILGNYSDTHSFANFTVGGLLEVTAFKRLTIVQTIAYIILIHVRLTLYFYAVNYLLKLIFPKKAAKIIFPLMGAAMYILTFVLAHKTHVINTLFSLELMSFLFITINLILPISIIMVSKLKRSLYEQKIEKAM